MLINCFRLNTGASARRGKREPDDKSSDTICPGGEGSSPPGPLIRKKNILAREGIASGKPRSRSRISRSISYPRSTSPDAARNETRSTPPPTRDGERTAMRRPEPGPEATDVGGFGTASGLSIRRPAHAINPGVYSQPSSRRRTRGRAGGGSVPAAPTLARPGRAWNTGADARSISAHARSGRPAHRERAVEASGRARAPMRAVAGDWAAPGGGRR